MSGYKYPNYGRQVRIEQYGQEVHLIFVAGSMQQADDVVNDLLNQLKQGHLQIKIQGQPSTIIERG